MSAAQKSRASRLGDDSRVLLRRRVAAPRDDYQQTLSAIAALVHDIEREVGRTGTVGVGIPGAISPATGLVKNANSTWLNGRPLADDLPRSARPAGALRERRQLLRAVGGDRRRGGGRGGRLRRHHRHRHRRRRRRQRPRADGAERDCRRVGTQSAARAARRRAAGPPCYCGRTGCIETFLSGPALARDYAAAGGGALTAREIAARAGANEPLALACLARYEDRMARALGSIINVLDPDVIVLGGGLSNIDRLYASVPALLPPYVFSDEVRTRLVRAAHGDSSGVRRGVAVGLESPHAIAEGRLQIADWIADWRGAGLRVGGRDGRAGCAAKAQELYHARCEKCHGPDGHASKTGEGRSFADGEWNHGSDMTSVMDVITNGVPETGMNGFKGKLSPDEILALAKYVRSLDKKLK